MGVDRRPWACQRGVSKRTNAGAEQETRGVSPRHTSSHPTTPDTSNCCSKVLGEGRQESSGGIESGGTRRTPWLNRASYNLEVARSPSYLRGAAGLTLPPSPATAHPPKAAVCSPSPTAALKSPPAPVRKGRPTKPAQRTACGGAAKALGSGGGGGGGGHGQHLLPPPAIQREVFKGGGGGGGGGGVSTGGVMANRSSTPASCGRFRNHGDEDPGLDEAVPSFSRSRGRDRGGGGGGSTPRTPRTEGENPSTPGLVEWPSSAGAVEDAAAAPSETQAMALPATPRVRKDPETPGFVSTPGICSPPAPCHRGTKGSGKRRVSSRLRTAVDLGVATSGPLPTGAGGARSGCECPAVKGGRDFSPCCGSKARLRPSGGDCASGCTLLCCCSNGASGGSSVPLSCRGGSRPGQGRRQGRPTRQCNTLRTRGGCEFRGAAGTGNATTGPDSVNDQMAAEAGAASRSSSESRNTGGGSCDHLESGCSGWGGLRSRNERVHDSSSVERFSDDLDGVSSTHDGPGWIWEAETWDGEGCERGRAVSRRRRRRRQRGARGLLQDQPEEESLIDFRGRMAAVASATRLCMASSSPAAAATAAPRTTTGTRNAFVVATPPHPTPSTTSDPPVLPRRRVLAAASPVLVPSPGSAASVAADDGFSTNASRGLNIGKRSDLSLGTGGSVRGGVSRNPDNIGVNCQSASASFPPACSTPVREGGSAFGPGTAEAGTAEAAAGKRPGASTASTGVAADASRSVAGERASLPKGGDGGRPPDGMLQKARTCPPMDPLPTPLKPSQRTAPMTRPWPDFENLRYQPPESSVSTPLRRLDWTVPHGSAMRALEAALQEAASGTACSSPLDMREERRVSIKRRYRERAEHFKLIQAARETSAGKNSAMLAVMRQRRQAEEDARMAKEQREARAARVKERVLMRLMEGRRAAFLAWARRARACRKAREMLRARESSCQLRVLTAWREDARRSRRVREFALKYLGGRKRTTFAAWKESTRRSIAARNMALRHLQGAQKASFYTWREAARRNARRRELALERSAMVRSALDGLGGTRSRFLRWKVWAGRRAAARRMGRRARDAGLRRCLLALAENQLSLRHLLEKRRLLLLATAFGGWRVGLGRLLRARLLPVRAGDVRRIDEGGGDVVGGGGGGGGGGGVSGSGSGAGDSKPPLVGGGHGNTAARTHLAMDGWGFAPPEEASASACPLSEARPVGERDGSTDPKESGSGDDGGVGGKPGAGVGREAEARAATCESGAWTWKGEVDSPLLPPSAFFAAANTSRSAGSFVEAVTVGSIDAAEVGTPGGDGERASSRAGSRRRGRRRRGRRDDVGGSRGGQTP